MCCIALRDLGLGNMVSSEGPAHMSHIGIRTCDVRMGPVLLHILQLRQKYNSAYYFLFDIDLYVVLMFLMRIYKDIFMLTIINKVI
jgi:hypothetical protein